MHVSAISIAPGPPAAAFDTVGDRLLSICERGWGDYFLLDGGPAHSWRLTHAEPGDPANVDGVEWCERLPVPLPEALLTAVYISPAARVYWSPLGREHSPEWPAWVRRINGNVARGARNGDCLVLADIHC